MSFMTWGEIKAKVENDLDLIDETFITDEEMLGYGNEAVRLVEADVHAINEDYFISRKKLNDPTGLVIGQEGYALPDGIYAHKIRRLIYVNGSTRYRIERFRDWKKFERYTEEVESGSGNLYAWLLDNSTPGTPKIILAPTPQEAGTFVTVWYIRQANRFVDDDSICDIPEFTNFVIQFVKVRCYEKEGNPNLQMAKVDLDAFRQQMVDTLTSMAPDTENDVEPDFSAYQEMS